MKSIHPHIRTAGKGIAGVLLLTGLYFIGEWLAGYIPFPVPGSVVGMVLVFVLLQLGVLSLKWVETATVWLLSFLGLFYVPYGVGIVESGPLIGEWGLQILAIIVVTVLSVFAFSGWVFRFFLSLTKTGDE